MPYLTELDALVTGGTGTIGTAIAERLEKLGCESIVIMSNDEDGLYHANNTLKSDVYRYEYADVRDSKRVRALVKGKDVVFHCAALKHVPRCEDNPLEAVKTNVIGTQNIIDACIEENCEFILISTDKAVNPISIMGVTKMLAEKITIKAGFKVVRFGNVLRSRGSVIPFWEKQAKEGKDVTITDKRMKRFFMTIDEAVDLIIWTWLEGYNSNIHIRDMKVYSIYDLAREIADKSGVSVVELGIGQGEKLEEELMTESEKSRSSIIGNYIVVSP